MARLRLALIGICIFFAGCGDTNAEKVDREITRMNSWTVSAEVVAEAVLRGDVPTRYTTRTLNTFNEQVQNSIDRMQGISDTRVSLALIPANQIKQIISEMVQALEVNDRNKLTELVNQIKTQQSSLRTAATASDEAR